MSEKDLTGFDEFRKNGEALGNEKVHRDLIGEYLSVLRSNLIPMILIWQSVS